MNAKHVVAMLWLSLSPIIIVPQACRTPQPNPPQPDADLQGYADALDACKAQGKDAGSYSVYENCAKQADVKFGRKGDAQ